MVSINSTHALWALLLVVAASGAAAIFDVRTRRIPNVLVAALFAAGLALNASLGWRFAGFDVLVTLAILIAGTLAFSLRLIGGGDVKLLAASGGTLMYPAALGFILYTLVCGGAIALLYAAARGRLVPTLRNVRGLAMPVFAGVAPAGLESGTPMPYALAICAGAIVTLVTSGLVPHLRFSWLPQ